MSQAEELLRSSSNTSAVMGSSRLGIMRLGESGSTLPEEEHIVIGTDRIVKVPDSLKRIAVQYDHNIETVTFDCPRYWDGQDMSTMAVYINYRRPDKVLGSFKAENVTVDAVDPNVMHFTWTISKNVTLAVGRLDFLVCTRRSDDEGNETNHWNSELNNDMHVSEGLEIDEIIIENYPDLIAQLLNQIERDVKEQVDEYFIENPLYTDPSLSEAGTPADAKAVGDKFKELSDTQGTNIENISTHDTILADHDTRLTDQLEMHNTLASDVSTLTDRVNGHDIDLEEHTHTGEDITSGTISSDRLPVVPTAKGGTGRDTWSANRVVYSTFETSLGQMGVPEANNSILMQDTTGAPRWTTPDNFFDGLNGLRVKNGTYVGTGTNTTIGLGVTPVLLFIHRPNILNTNMSPVVFTTGYGGSAPQYSYDEGTNIGYDPVPAILTNGGKVGANVRVSSGTGTNGSCVSVITLSGSSLKFVGAGGSYPYYMNVPKVTYNWVAIY